MVTRRGLPLVKLKGLVALPDHLVSSCALVVELFAVTVCLLCIMITCSLWMQVPLVVALASWLACDQTQTLHSQPFRRHRHRSSPRRRSQWRQHRPGLKQ